MTQPFVTIAIPCLNEARYIEKALATIAAQTYPHDRFEILVADGGSTDGTRDILARLGADDARIRMIDNPKRLQAAGMNEMLAVAKGEIIVRMDVHCEYAPDYVEACVRVLDQTGADNVGGAQRARAETTFQHALCAALTSPLGVGGAKYRSEDAEGFVDTVFLGAFRRAVLDRVGAYDPGAITNEDAELNQRILDAGGKVFLSKEIVVHYFPRASLEALAKQYYRYGRGRARTLLKHGRLTTIRPALPAMMVAGGLSLLATSLVQPFTIPAFAMYGAGVLAEAIRVGRRERASIPTIAAIFPTLHVAHGTGFLIGLVRYGVSPDWTDEAKLQPRNA